MEVKKGTVTITKDEFTSIYSLSLAKMVYRNPELLMLTEIFTDLGALMTGLVFDHSEELEAALKEQRERRKRRTDGNSE